jgi:hypothetical protein
MTDKPKLERPPLSGPGSDLESWKRFAAQELDVPLSDFDDPEMKRADVIALLDNDPKAYAEKDEKGHPTGYRVVPETDATQLREAPEGVDVVESAKAVSDALGRPTWATPVEGGFAAELELEK